MTSKYESPLSSRYASEYMLNLFSSDTRYSTWRKLWVSLAKAEMALGLPITEEQVKELEAHIDDIDYECVREREKEVRHDVMAHVYAYGKVAPSAAGIIHLGATSCYVTDNADLVIYREALVYLRSELLKVIKNLSDFAEKYKALPTLGYTHYQPAQLVTVGKRATLWMQDFLSDLNEIDFAIENIKFLGCRGTTGTEASFVDLFAGEDEKINEMNKMIAKDFGFTECFDVCGQTYPRKVDSRILNCLSSVAQSCYRMANDIRLLQHDRQVEEPFEKNQYLAQLTKIPDLLALLSSIQSSVKVQPDVASKITTVSSQIEGVKSTLDSMEKKIGTTRTVLQDRQERPKEPVKKRRWPFSMFSRKK